MKNILHIDTLYPSKASRIAAIILLIVWAYSTAILLSNWNSFSNQVKSTQKDIEQLNRTKEALETEITKVQTGQVAEASRAQIVKTIDDNRLLTSNLLMDLQNRMIGTTRALTAIDYKAEDSLKIKLQTENLQEAALQMVRLTDLPPYSTMPQFSSIRRIMETGAYEYELTFPYHNQNDTKEGS